jgi:3-deoxy-manno-octulosonate cytidylyltransferase (CMP-KDO synthetase)
LIFCLTFFIFLVLIIFSCYHGNFYYGYLYLSDKKRIPMKFIVLIPARFQSTRFPGKPLALLGGKPVIQWVYENSAQALDDVWVATDDVRIFKAVESFGGKAVYTQSAHKSGTDRCAEAALALEKEVQFDGVVNIQGDEPFVRAEQIRQLTECFDNNTSIATLIREIDNADELFNPNRPKVVIDNHNNALYFSRSPVPHVRGEMEGNWHLYHQFWSHVGMYAYTKKVLQELTQLAPGKLEKAESLEQLRWLENGYRIKTAETQFQSIGIDTPADLQAAELLLK